MKILLDPVLTSDPGTCSTNVQFHEFVSRVIDSPLIEDTFFYWVIPSYVTEEQAEYYPKHPHVVYIRMERSKDRVRDYITLSDEFSEVLAFNGSHWDFDVLLTVRTGLIPLMRMHMMSPRDTTHMWLKKIWLIEDMPMMAFKKTVPVIGKKETDIWTLQGYQNADKVFVCSYHEIPEILKTARQHHTPSQVIAMSKKLTPIVTSQFETYQLKPKEKQYSKGKGRPFGLAYIGRMEKADNIVDIKDLMEKIWILRGKAVNLVVCTVSKVMPVFDKNLVTLKQPGREEFWDIVQAEVDVFLKMPKGGGFSLSLIEPIMLGTPVISLRGPIYESLLGKDYPFFASSMANVYALVKLFYDDYATQYERFAVWQQGWFKETYNKRLADDLLYDKLEDCIASWHTERVENQSLLGAVKNNDIVRLIAEEMTALYKDDPENCTMAVAFERLSAAGKIGHLADKIKLEDRATRRLSFSTSMNQIRVGLQMFYGFRDASTKVGHLMLMEDTNVSP